MVWDRKSLMEKYARVLYCSGADELESFLIENDLDAKLLRRSSDRSNIRKMRISKLLKKEPQRHDLIHHLEALSIDELSKPRPDLYGLNQILKMIPGMGHSYARFILKIFETSSRLKEYFSSIHDYDRENFYKIALSLFLERNHWIRRLESFRARSHNPHRILRELIYHLVGEKPVPKVFDAAWSFPEVTNASFYRHLWIENSAGKSIRKRLRISRPIFNILSRMDSKQNLDRAILSAHFSYDEVNKEFSDYYADVILRTVQDLNIPFNGKISSIMKILSHHKPSKHSTCYLVRSIYVSDEINYYNLWKKSYQNIIKDCAIANKYVELEELNLNMRWNENRHNLPTFLSSEGDATEDHESSSCGWVFRPLNTTKLIMKDGYALKNCMSYLHECFARDCLEKGYEIWSIRKKTDFQERRIVTIILDVDGTPRNYGNLYYQDDTEDVLRIFEKWLSYKKPGANSAPG